jgi:hypothetical protein
VDHAQQKTAAALPPGGCPVALAAFFPRPQAELKSALFAEI